MEKSSFFNAELVGEDYDRTYLAEDYARYFASFIGNGVFPNPSTNLQIIANNDMTINLTLGKAWINGYYYENTDNLNLAIIPAEGVLNRIDRIVLRLDFLNREIKCYVKQGSFASSPIAPALVRDADMYELGIADIAVNKGVIKITQDNITDLRLDNNYCGIVHGTIEQVDVTTLYNQYATAFADKETVLEADFNTWFATIKAALDGDTAGNLLNLINANSAEIGDLALIPETDLITAIKNDRSSLASMSSQEVNKGASLIGLNDIDSLFTATNVEGALKEVFTFANDGRIAVASSVNAKGISATSADTFSVLATKIDTPSLVNTADANAGANRILTGYIAYANGVKLDGTIPKHVPSNLPLTNAVSFSSASSVIDVIPEYGYFDGYSAKVRITDSDFKNSNILDTANVFGLQGTATAGKKWASGTVYRGSSVSGLAFAPRTVILQSPHMGITITDNSEWWGYETILHSIDFPYGTGHFTVLDDKTKTSDYENEHDSGVTLTSNGFTPTIWQPGTTMNWIAFE